MSHFKYMRVGIGYDIHRFIGERPLMLGGIEIPYIMGLEGHSDGDVLIHAICDAILGAGGLNDIGYHFPVHDDRYRGVNSILLLEKVKDMVQEKGFKVSYIDTVLILEEPKIEPFKENMKDKISMTLGISNDNVNIKATTQEGIGAIGRKEGAGAYAVVGIDYL